MIFKYIKTRRAQKKRKKRLQRYINLEIIEVLATICRYLETEGRRMHNPMARPLGVQSQTLTEFREMMRDEILKEEQKDEADNPNRQA
jgi:hypothetical protein